MRCFSGTARDGFLIFLWLPFKSSPETVLKTHIPMEPRKKKNTSLLRGHSCFSPFRLGATNAAQARNSETQAACQTSISGNVLGFMFIGSIQSHGCTHIYIYIGCSNLRCLKTSLSSAFSGPGFSCREAKSEKTRF